MIGLALSLVATLAVFVLPGFGLLTAARLFERRRRGGSLPPPRPPVESAVLAVAWSAIALSLFGAVLLGAGAFDHRAVGAFAAILALLGLPAFFSALIGLRGSWPVAAVLALLSIPFAWTALRSNLTPSHSYQWYYWDLGRQLDAAGGVPSSVLEFGLSVRWHPDYVFATIATEAYRALSFPLGETAAIVDYRVPLFGLAIAATYVVFRLWVGRVPALVGVAATSATTLYVTKFNAYKPETIGIAVGLFATWLLVSGIRKRARGTVVLAGALFGVAVGIHGIAAAVTGILALCAALAEISALAGPERKRALGAGLRAAGLALAIVFATGLSLQGRALVATDAGHPARASGDDATWTFLNRHNGTFFGPSQPSVGEQATRTLSHPWPGRQAESWGWIAGCAAALIAVVLAMRRGGRPRRAGLALLGAVLIVATAMLFFGTQFDTFIPQHTGLTRIAIYLGLFYGLGIALAAHLALDWMQRRGRFAGRLAALGPAAAAFFAAWAIGVGVISLDKYGGIGEEGRRALAALEARAGGNDEAVLSNISSRGLIEFSTGLEAPLESRQPVIEDPQFLDGANAALLRVHRYFQRPARPRLLRQLGVRWLLVSNGSRGIGSPFHLGLPFGQAERLARQPYLERAWRGHNISLFRVNGAVREIEPVGPAKSLGLHVLLAVLAVAVAVRLACGGRTPASIGRLRLRPRRAERLAS